MAGSRKSVQSLNRRLNSVQKSDRRSRALSNGPRQLVVSYDDAFSYALRVAYLHYLLQPRQKRKQFVPAPKPVGRAYTSRVGDLVKEFLPGNSSSVKLPHNFRGPLEKRMQAIVIGQERQPGYSDAAVRRTFAEVYTAFTEKAFQKTIDKERKVEPLVLIFYSAATRACRPTAADLPGDDTWKMLVDRHVAMFLRLVSSVIRDMGSEKDKPDLMHRLKTLEGKLLSNDENLVIGASQPGGHHIEVPVPLSYDVKDMPLVQVVAKIFGLSNSDVQGHIDAQRPNWTEETALKDLKTYQHRLNSNMAGTLRSYDFEFDEAFDAWKRSEAPHLSQMMMEILRAKPELAKTSSGLAGLDKNLPASPTGDFDDDQSYAELGRMIASPDAMLGFDGLGGLSLEDNSSIRTVDEAHYTFIPPNARAFYKTITKYALEYDAMHGDPAEQMGPFSMQTLDLLTTLCVHWRLPQFTRLVVTLEIAASRFVDGLLPTIDLNDAFELVKTPEPPAKKHPLVYFYGESLSTIDRNLWTIQDLQIYRQTLTSLHEALLREVYDTLMHCYQEKAPKLGPAMRVLEDHIAADPSFTTREEDAEAYAEVLREGLKDQAHQVYREYLDQNISGSKEDWDFSHVVKLGNSVVQLSQRIKKRYKTNPEVMGASPLACLTETILPLFEHDAEELLRTIIEVARNRGEEYGSADGFALYQELVKIRDIHRSSLPHIPFAFDVEELLVGFVWRWLENAETATTGFIENAIKEDQFQVRSADEGNIALDQDRHSSSILDTFRSFSQMARQIFDLKWENDVHNARFMTALSRIFSNGIALYCEIADVKFVREMDAPRQKNDGEAAAVQTTQGKFMKYAKDAWNQKEKIEPFQFYSESLVKLNNIEYAMQALDKLETEMQVDQCAEILQKAEGPRKQGKRPSKYVFTIKIVEAEDLKACDANGSSDPYVVLGDEYHKRLAKTRTISRNLNPRWDESVDITVTGPLNIVATIWDYDTFGDHDFVGRTFLKLDPIHFGDYLPREYWLDLDTQGRLLLRVSMEGERDDIQFHFGKAFRHLKRTERDMVRKITDKLISHINISLSPEALRNLLGRGLLQSATSLWKRQSRVPTVTDADIENALQPLFNYFNENFAIMKQSLTEATMIAVMTRLWKEVLMAIESLVVPPLSEKPSTQKPLAERELEVVYRWLELLFQFFNARDEDGEILGVAAEVLKSPKYHELASLNFFYFEDTAQLIQTSERMAATTALRAKQMMETQLAASPNRLSAPASLGGAGSAGPGFASMGTIRRGKSIMMSRNLGTMRRVKEEKRKEAQADPNDDMILRILRMRPEAANYLKERHRQKERQAAAAAAQLIVKQSVSQGWNAGAGGGFGRGGIPRR